MSEQAIEAKIAYIQKMFSHIDTILQRHGGISDALADEAEARAAIMLSLMQIGETIHKIDSALLEKFDLLDDAKGAYSVHNFIAHDYEGVDLDLIAEIMEDNLPELVQKVERLKASLIEEGLMVSISEPK